ncbi:MAG: DUF308 domain-containing protein [Ruminococcus sp.]|nr:DUF308 domain-containing protein [Ruminococcus sp.]
MTVLSIILGVLMVIAGFLCLVTPIGATFSLMYLFMILLFVMGIVSFVRCIVNKNFGVEFAFSIITIIAGILILFSSYATFFTEIVMIYLMAGWLVVRGIVGIVMAVQAKHLTGTGLFVAALILSILTILAGIYSFFHPVIFSGFLGILASVYFIIAGIDMICDAIITKSQNSDENA